MKNTTLAIFVSLLGGMVMVQVLMSSLLMQALPRSVRSTVVSLPTISNLHGPNLLREATFTGSCRSHKLFNDTWGRPMRRFVDKYDTKLWVDRLSDEIRIVPTVALYDASNLSLFTKDALVQMSERNNLIIKPTHAWANTARVWNQTYTCFRSCRYHVGQQFSIAEEPVKSHALAFVNMLHPMQLLPRENYLLKETQYRHLPKRVIVEEHLDPGVQEYHWWAVHGQPIFVCARCDLPGRKRGSYYTSDFRELTIQSVLEPCPDSRRPRIWDRMEKAVKEIGAHVPGIVSIDLYANDSDIFFSEFTFTRYSCASPFKPWTADALLHQMEQKQVPPELVTPDYVLRTVHDRSWAFVNWDSHWEWKPSYYPSAMDMCLDQNSTRLGLCLNQANMERHEDSDIHCVVTEGPDDVVAKSRFDLEMFPLRPEVTFGRLFDRLDSQWAACILLLYLLLTTQSSQHQSRSRKLEQWWPMWINSLLYLLAVSLYKSQQPKFAAMWDPSKTLAATVAQSFQVFTKVHPISSVTVALTHFATYWIPIAALSSRRFSRMLLWWFMYEVGTALVNEWSHFEESDAAVRCTRVAFIARAKRYALNDVIRAYVLPPLFVYGYLLPKFVLHWLTGS